MCKYTGRNRDVIVHQKVCKAYKKAADKANSKYDTLLKSFCDEMNIKVPDKWRSMKFDDL